MIQPIIDRSYLVEINLGTIAVGRKINFQYIPQLEGAEIYGIQSFQGTQLSTSPNASPVIATGAGIVVNFFVQDDEQVFQMPYQDLNSNLLSGFVRLFNDKKINITKSFITILDVTGINNDESALFQFLFKKK